MHGKSILIIAFEMPPARSAGVQRPYCFAKYLLDLGWDVYIITASANAYQRHDNGLEVSPELKERMFRANAIDTHKTLSIAGKSPDFVSIPDRYWPWYFSSVSIGKKIVKEKKIDVIWSTYPVLTSHLIGLKLSRTYNIPWIADYRDPLQCHYNPDYRHFNGIIKYLEKKIVKQAKKIVLTCQPAADLYSKIHSDLPKHKFVVIENGFVANNIYPQNVRQKKFILLYSGVLYTTGRDISSLLIILQELKLKKIINDSNFLLRFRGAEKTATLGSLISELGLTDIIEFLPAVSFTEALSEMHNASATLLIQDKVFNYQVPGKLYDYIQSKRPVIAICPSTSATADVCKQIPFCFRVWDKKEIENILIKLISTSDTLEYSSFDVEGYSRKARTFELEQILNEVVV